MNPRGRPNWNHTMDNTTQDTRDSTACRHLARLRDFLDLPFNTLQNDELSFYLPDKQLAFAARVGDAHLRLICQIGKADALQPAHWRALVQQLSAAYDCAFPCCPVIADSDLALLWTCRADVSEDQWLRWCEDALTFALMLHERIPSKQARPN
jgi:hypothetical protein